MLRRVLNRQGQGAAVCIRCASNAGCDNTAGGPIHVMSRAHSKPRKQNLENLARSDQTEGDKHTGHRFWQEVEGLLRTHALERLSLQCGGVSRLVLFLNQPVSGRMPRSSVAKNCRLQKKFAKPRSCSPTIRRRYNDPLAKEIEAAINAGISPARWIYRASSQPLSEGRRPSVCAVWWRWICANMGRVRGVPQSYCHPAELRLHYSLGHVEASGVIRRSPYAVSQVSGA
jgi:hypothetical protein